MLQHRQVEGCAAPLRSNGECDTPADTPPLQPQRHTRVHTATCTPIATCPPVRTLSNALAFAPATISASMRGTL